MLAVTGHGGQFAPGTQERRTVGFLNVGMGKWVVSEQAGSRHRQPPPPPRRGGQGPRSQN